MWSNFKWIPLYLKINVEQCGLLIQGVYLKQSLEQWGLNVNHTGTSSDKERKEIRSER